MLGWVYEHKSIFSVFSLQVISTLQSSQVSVCLAWTQISLKTPFWSQVTQPAHFRFGIFLPLQWTSNLRCAENKIAPGVLHLISPYTWHILLSYRQLVNNLHCCNLGGLTKGLWYVWKSLKCLTDCLSWQHQLMVQLDCGQRTAIMWGFLGKRWRGISLTQERIIGR